MTRVFFLRHAETKVEMSRPVTDWTLTQSGEEMCRELVNTGVFDEVGFVVTSDERKAVLTGRIVSERLGCKTVQRKELRELDRGLSPKVSIEDYRECVKRAMASLSEQVTGWESAEHALTRFRRGLDDFEGEDGESLLVVSHGIVLTLHFSELMNEMHNAFNRWLQLSFCAWGLIEDNKVLRDIVT